LKKLITEAEKPLIDKVFEIAKTSDKPWYLA